VVVYFPTATKRSSHGASWSIIALPFIMRNMKQIGGLLCWIPLVATAPSLLVIMSTRAMAQDRVSGSLSRNDVISSAGSPTSSRVPWLLGECEEIYQALKQKDSSPSLIELTIPPHLWENRGGLVPSPTASRAAFEEAKARSDGGGFFHPDRYLAGDGTIAPSGMLGRIQAKYRDFKKQINVPSVTITKVTVTSEAILNYPAQFARSDDAKRVRIRQIEISYSAPGRTGAVQAYFLNYDKVDQRRPAIVLAFSGHFWAAGARDGERATILDPSCAEIGFYVKDGNLDQKYWTQSNAPIGMLAVLDYPIIAFDWAWKGVTEKDTKFPLCQHVTDFTNSLQNILTEEIVVDRLLRPFSQVDAIGLSGGGEQLYHYLMLAQNAPHSAYIAGLFRPPWDLLYDKELHEDFFSKHFDWTELVVAGRLAGTNVALASNAGEDGAHKAYLNYWLFPAANSITGKLTQRLGSLELRGDDRDGDGYPDGGVGHGCLHEYNVPDLVDWLTRQGWLPRVGHIQPNRGNGCGERW
jgi:hypothetical protein